MPKIKQFIKATLLVALITCVLFEVSLRILGISFLNFYQFDEYLGHSLRPGYEGWYTDEGKAYIRINHDGMRDFARPKEKPENTLRIAVLGDSFIEAAQVPLEQGFCQVLQRKLSACSSKKIEVLNFGVGGYGTAQELLMLKSRVWQYSPDIVLLAFYSGNDLSDNVRDYPLYEYHQNNNYYDIGKIKFWLKIKIKATLNFLKLHLRIVQVYYKVRNAIEIKQTEQAPIKYLHPGLKFSWNEVYREPISRSAEEAWSITEKLLLLMRDEVRRQGAEFLVVTLATSPQYYPDAQVRREIEAALEVKDLFYPDRRIKRLGEREGFAVLNLAQPFQAYADEHKVFLSGFPNSAQAGKGHWNATAHELAGELVGKRLGQICQQKWPSLNLPGGDGRRDAGQ